MSKISKTVYVVYNAVLGTKLFKGITTVRKYQNQYADLKVNKFEDLNQAKEFIEYLKKNEDKNILNTIKRKAKQINDAESPKKKTKKTVLIQPEDSQSEAVAKAKTVKRKRKASAEQPSQPIALEAEKITQAVNEQQVDQHVQQKEQQVDQPVQEEQVVAQGANKNQISTNSIKIPDSESLQQQKFSLEEVLAHNQLFKFYKSDPEAFEKIRAMILKEATYSLFFDGATLMNPGLSGIGYLLFDHSSKKLFENSIGVGIRTNNQTEYLALIYGLTTCLQLGIQRINCFGDSQLIIRQMLTQYRVKNKNIFNFYQAATMIAQQFQQIQFKHIPRELNASADRLAMDAVKRNRFR